MALSAGRLRHRVTIYRKTVQQAANLDLETVWAPIAEVWAEVIGVAGREATIGQALQGISAYKITVRFGVDVTDADQLRYGTLDLNIHSVTDPDGMREQLLIIADTASVEKMD